MKRTAANGLWRTAAPGAAISSSLVQTDPSPDANAPHASTAPSELLRRLRNGEPEAKNELLGYCYPRVLRMVRARLGSRLRVAFDPSDIVQDTMLEASERLEHVEIQEFGQLVNWLGKIAYHRITGAARQLDRIPPTLGALASSTGASGIQPPERSSILSPSAQVAQDDQLERLLILLDVLPPRQREVVLLRDFAEESWAMIAEDLGFEGPSGACMLYARAWKALRARLPEDSGRA